MNTGLSFQTKQLIQTVYTVRCKWWKFSARVFVVRRNQRRDERTGVTCPCDAEVKCLEMRFKNR